MSATVRRPSPILESFGAPSREGPNPSPWKRFSLMGKVQKWLLEDMFNVSGFPPSPPPSGRPTENVSHVCFAPNLGRRKQQVPLSSQQTGQSTSKTSCGCIQGALSQGSGSKTAALFKNVAYFCHQAPAAAPWGARGGVPSKVDWEFSIQPQH